MKKAGENPLQSLLYRQDLIKGAPSPDEVRRFRRELVEQKFSCCEEIGLLRI